MHPVADPDLELRGKGGGGGGLAFLALLPFIPSVISFFFPKIMGGGGPPGPSSRSATGTNEFSNQTYLFIRPTGLTLSLNKNFEAILTLDVHCSCVFLNQGVHHGKHRPQPFQNFAQKFVDLQMKPREFYSIEIFAVQSMSPQSCFV